MLKNIQDRRYPVMEHFYTLQGEGFWSGSAAYFIRLAGCDVGCSWCDVKESWDASNYASYSSDQIAAWLPNHAKIAVITGGEPTLHYLDSLTSVIRDRGLRVHLETSGTSPLTGTWDWTTFSPKRFKKPLEEYYEKSNELKIIISHRNDFRWALDHQKMMNQDAKCFVQPEWDRRHILEKECVQFVKDHPDFQLSLQTHKYLNID